MYLTAIFEREFFYPAVLFGTCRPIRMILTICKKMSYRTALFEIGWLICMIHTIYYDYHNDNDDDEDHVDSHKNSGGHSPFDPSARTGLHSIYTRHYTSPPLLLILGALFGSSLPVLTADRQNCDIMPPKRLFQTDNVSSRLF